MRGDFFSFGVGCFVIGASLHNPTQAVGGIILAVVSLFCFEWRMRRGMR